MNKYNFSVVISAFGNKLDIFLETLKKSIYENYPNIQIKVYGKKNDKELNQIEELRKNCEFCRFSPGSLKLIYWNKGLIEADTEWILFLDVDTLLLKPLDYLFEFCLLNQIEILFSWRDRGAQFVNSGVMLVRKNKNTLNFFNNYKNSVIKDVLDFKNDQQTFMNLLVNNSTFQSISKSKNKNEEFIFVHKKIMFGSIPCKIMNNSNPLINLSDRTIIQHYKGILGTLITQDAKDNRYKNLIGHKIYRYNFKSIKNIDYKIQIWKKYASKDLSKKIINIHDYYQSTKNKLLNVFYRYLPVIFYKIIDKFILRKIYK